MSESFSRPVLLDATVLSNFASTDSVTWLTSTLEGLSTVPAVEMELRQGHEKGYAYLANALEVIDGGQITVNETAPEQLEQAYPKIQKRLDPGEAEAFVAADTTGGTLVTDDGAARQLASAYEIELTGSIGLLVRGVVREDLTIKTADDWLTTWIDERSYYAPVESVHEVLPEE
ncbi:hypothetical protein OB955_14670 [Halobacteria archaeon AArc-m2/3/4]|uniref:PIN domain-containing protein n=1 Tax=Natronoglomus mannanivorans TaxID=2979990 RepID=A0ABT2QGC0_9EURY|nr:hypothetical protein [Halobacteria archaeon AArc-m2/3/4]